MAGFSCAHVTAWVCPCPGHLMSRDNRCEHVVIDKGCAWPRVTGPRTDRHTAQTHRGVAGTPPPCLVPPMHRMGELELNTLYHLVTPWKYIHLDHTCYISCPQYNNKCFDHHMHTHEFSLLQGTWTQCPIT